MARPAPGRPGGEPRRAGQPGPPGARRSDAGRHRHRRVRAGRRLHRRRHGVPRRDRAGPRGGRRPRRGAAGLPAGRWRCGASRWPRTPTPTGPASPGSGCTGPGWRCCERAARAALALGDSRHAAGWAADAVAAEPLRESAALVLAQALAAAGDPAAALARLAELRARLADELGVDPSPEVAQLQLALLRGEVPAGPAGRGARSRGARGRFGDLAFVGRDAELARLRAVVAGPRGRDARRGRRGGQVAADRRARAGVAAAGDRRAGVPAGARRGVGPGPVAAARGARRSTSAVAERLPPRIRDALAGLLPELGDGPAAALDGESRRALLLAGGLRVLEAATGRRRAARRRRPAVGRPQQPRPARLGARPAAPARRGAGVPARRARPPGCWPSCAARGPGVEVVLGPLPAEAVGRLVGDPDLARAVLDATDRTPFAVAELLRELAARDVLGRRAGRRLDARAPRTPRRSRPSSAGRASAAPSGAAPSGRPAARRGAGAARAAGPGGSGEHRRRGRRAGRPDRRSTRSRRSPPPGWCGSASRAGPPRTTSSPRP